VPHVDVPVALGLGVGTLGSLLGAATGHGHIYFDSLASLVFLLRVGRYIQFRAQHRTGLSIAKLLRVNYTLATRIDEAGARQSVPAYRLGTGDLVEVLPGQIVPADGVVSDGNSLIQTAFITGESAPVLVQPGSEVIGGSANLQSPIRLKISAAGDESRMGRLSQMVRSATASRTPLVQRADRIGGIFVVAVVALAVATFSGWVWLRDAATATQHTVALLTIACPCALALAAPLVITIALGRAAKEGIWIRDGEALERLATPGVIWFDKTGTLTFGDLQVLHWSGDDAVLRRVSALEAHSDHPAAKAIVRYALRRLPDWNPRLYQVEQVEQVYGRGIRGRVDGVDISVGEVASPTEGDTDGKLERERRPASDSLEIQVLVAGIEAGSFRMGDRERPDAIASLRSLAHAGWNLGMLSGDRDLEVQRMGQRLRAAGVPLIDCVGDLSPEEKLERVLESRRAYPTTVMVGDGINDAAALSAADVGIAIRGSGENCLRHAPIYIPDNQLLSVVRLMDASRQSVRGIHRCFAASLLYNSVTISLAVSGWIHPLVAAIFMPISGLTVLSMALLSRTFPAPSSLGGSSGPEKPAGSVDLSATADSRTTKVAL
jgi:Cu2+-exporting ATPase